MTKSSDAQAARDSLRALIDETIAWESTLPPVRSTEQGTEEYAREDKILASVRAAPPEAYDVLLSFLTDYNFVVPILRGLESHPSEAAELLVSEAEQGRVEPLARFASNLSYDKFDGLRRELGVRLERVKKVTAGVKGGNTPSLESMITSIEGLSPKQMDALRKGLLKGSDKAYKTFCEAAGRPFDPRLADLVPDVVAACRRGMQTQKGRSRAWGAAISSLTHAAQVIEMDPEFFLWLRATSPDSNEAENAFIGLKNIARRLEATGRKDEAEALRAKFMK